MYDDDDFNRSCSGVEAGMMNEDEGPRKELLRLEGEIDRVHRSNTFSTFSQSP